MSAGTVADMLADLLGPVADPEDTPAKAANRANPKHPCGATADSEPANALRILANPRPQATETGPDSQTFAEIRNPDSPPQSEHWRGLSQDSQDSQGHPPACDPVIVARLIRWGWKHAEAKAQADRLRDRDEHADFRHLCIECTHYRPGRCGNHRAADLRAAEVGRDLATMFQDCAGFARRVDA